jgi:glycine cleavage system aminomethyltransferase T
VNRKLTGLRWEGVQLPPLGSTVLSGDADVGWTVSTVESFGLQCPIALAYVRREFLEPGTRVQVSSEGTVLEATVHVLPFAGVAA